MPAEKLIDPRLKPVMMGSHNNASSQALMKDHLNANLRNNASEESMELKQMNGVKSPNYVSRADWLTLAILTFVNLINYMDRYTIAGNLAKVKEAFDIDNAKAGLLSTAFVASFMIFAPLFGYLGDRYNRKWVMVVGIVIWSVATLVGSFIKEDFWTFMLMRAIVGIGEASYTTVAPTILSDLFVKEMRSKALAIFYFAIPVGAGLGYVVGKALADFFGGWEYALRGTPILGVIAVLAIIVFMKDPPRGESEGHDQLKASSYGEDLKSLLANKSFLLSTLGLTCVTFCTGALTWWAPNFLENSIKSMNIEDAAKPMNPEKIAFAFGVVTMLSGIIGVPLGSFSSLFLRPKEPRADPLICGLGLALSSVFMCIAIFACNHAFFLAFILIFLGEIMLNLNWSIVADILLYVVVPTRRGTAEATQILFSHLFGDAGSPYFIGIVSDWIKVEHVTQEAYCPPLAPEDLKASNATILCEANRDFYSMQYSLVINILIVFIGGVCFFLSAIYLVRDKERVERFVADESERVEKEDMIKSENNSTWSDEENPPILVVSKNEIQKFEPLLKPLAYKQPKI